MKSTIFVIDAYNLIYRMFYAVPEMHTREGIQVNAIFGVAKFLKNLSESNPDSRVVVATDLGPSFREKIFSEYKWTRDRMPDNLRMQIDWVFSLFKASNIQIIWKEWYEADDIMGTIATKYWNDENQVVIISSDKDLCQFVVDDKIHIYDAMKRKFMREKDVLEKFWVPTTQVRDYLAIVGDSSDNIPGLTGFGPKKTQDLLSKYNTLDGIYDHIDNLTPKVKILLEEWREKAYLSQQLATIITDLEIENIDEENFSNKIKSPEYIEILKKYEFKSLLPSSEIIQIQKPEIKTQNIEKFSECENLCEKWKNSQNFLWLFVDLENNIYISDNWIVYIFDSKKIDCNFLIDCILNWEIRVSGYNIKNIFLQLSRIKNPIQKTTNQESLF